MFPDCQTVFSLQHSACLPCLPEFFQGGIKQAWEQALLVQKLARLHLAQHSVSPDKTGLRKLSMLWRTWLKSKTKGHLLSWLQLPDSVFRHLQKAMFCVARGSCSYLLRRSWVCASVPQGSWDEAIRNRQLFLNQDLVPASPLETEWQTVIASQVLFQYGGQL